MQPFRHNPCSVAELWSLPNAFGLAVDEDGHVVLLDAPLVLGPRGGG